MRILHLIDSGGIYGAERILLYLASEQQRQGHSPMIGSICRPGGASSAVEGAARTCGIPAVPIRIAPRPTPRVVRDLLAAVRATGADLVHSHGYKANILLGPLPRRVRGPMMTTLHGWTGAQRFSALRIYEALDKLALRRIDAVGVVARSMLQLPAVRHLSDVRLIENGIPTRESRLEDLRKRGAPDLSGEIMDFMRRRPTLLAIGRLSREKGFDLLIDAFARARASSDDGFQLVIVGEGAQRSILEARIRQLRLQDQVMLTGYVDGAERLFRSAMGFVISSLTEGMPLVLLEAMQWQVPIMATNVGAIPELLDYGKRGILVAPGEIGELAAGLGELLQPVGGSATARVALAYAAVSNHYSSVRMADEYFAAYRDIA